MLQKPVHDTDGLNVRTHARYTRHKCTDTSHDDANLDTCIAGLIEFLDQFLVDQTIHLEEYARWPAMLGIIGLMLDELNELLAGLEG